MPPLQELGTNNSPKEGAQTNVVLPPANPRSLYQPNLPEAISRNPQSEVRNCLESAKECKERGDLDGARQHLKRGRDLSRSITDPEKRSIQQGELIEATAEAGDNPEPIIELAAESAGQVVDHESRSERQLDLGNKCSRAARHFHGGRFHDPKIYGALRHHAHGLYHSSIDSARLIEDPYRRAAMMDKIATSMKEFGFDAKEAELEAARAHAQAEAAQIRQDQVTTSQAVHLAEHGDYRLAINRAEDIQDSSRRSIALKKIANVMMQRGEREKAKDALIRAQVPC